ncbi:MAG: sulfite exporter TauE/SafE family protein [Dehalococcoidia bacterium]|nr:sulfite exporter TauE/SafE family protein [Dehalococcoidia bacterium]
MDERTLKAIAVGALIGLFDGLTGVGGGAILVAFMVSWLGMSQHLAQGTTPAVIVPVAFFGAITYAVQGMNGRFLFDISLALSLIPALAFPSIFGVFIGATWMSALPAAQLRRAFGVFLFFIAFSMLTRGILPIGTPPGASIAVPFIFWIMLGFVTGVLSGFLGIGGALVMAPFMTLGAGIPQHMSQGIILAVVTITSVVGVYAQYRRSNVSMETVLTMAPSSLIAVVAGSLLAGQMDAFWLTKIFGLAMAYFAYQFAFVRPREFQQKANPSAGFYSI